VQLFVKAHREIKSISPILLSQERKDATYKEILEPFLNTLQLLIDENRYESSLI
jgi:hypothetical protein